ncbi:hypothetical protein ABT127_16800 [Streptomyces sp. NPDC001904]|uniref:hypothetical protein n=1 Tax=Streptomyces sp. NPDC001904 TaxID=3154531 RepID=UPI00332D92B7
MYENVTTDTAAERIVEWCRAGDRGVVELMGSTGSGRTATLLRVRRLVPDAVWVDAAGLGADEVADLARDALRGRREDAAPAVVLVAQAQRLAGTHGAGYPGAALTTLSSRIAEALDALLVVEVDWHDEWSAARRRLEVAVPARTPADSRSASMSREWALQALALARRGLVPLEVWRRLSRSLNGGDLDLPVDAPDVSAVGDAYRLDDLTRQTELAGAVDRGAARRVHGEVARWLRGQVGEPTGTGRYAEGALALHAAAGGRYGEYFQELKEDPALLARLSPHSLIEAERTVAAHLNRVRRDPGHRDRYARWSAPSLPGCGTGCGRVTSWSWRRRAGSSPSRRPRPSGSPTVSPDHAPRTTKTKRRAGRTTERTGTRRMTSTSTSTSILTSARSTAPCPGGP